MVGLASVFCLTQKENEMLEKLQELFKAIGLPVGLVAVIVTVAAFIGLPLEQAMQLFGVLVGVPFVIALVIDILKQFGVVDDGTAGKWSAVLNLVVILALAVLLKFIPNFDVVSIDAKILELAKAVAIIVVYLIQLFGTKSAHRAYVQGLGYVRFSHSSGLPF
jgi:uncharacterized membrane protein YczE